MYFWGCVVCFFLLELFKNILLRRNKMYILVSGSRSICDKKWIYEKLFSVCRKYNDVVIVGGGCSRGVDSFLSGFCKDFGYGYVEMKADWVKYGRGGGMVRNKEMIKFVKSKGGICVCLWNGFSGGCKNVIVNWGWGCIVFEKSNWW